MMLTSRHPNEDGQVRSAISDGALQDPAAVGDLRVADEAGRVWTVIIDDDPTGTQTVRDLPVLTATWTEDDLTWAASQPGGACFVLTNSRSHDEPTARRLTDEVVRNASAVAQRLKVQLRVVSRGDSTLRGHFATEVAAAHNALRDTATPARGTVFVPSFLEAGRVTVHDVQWVEVDSTFVPAVDTDYAQDATFGYAERSLLQWVRAHLAPQHAQVHSVTLDSLRGDDGRASVSAAIGALHGEDVLVTNAATPGDLEVLMAGLQDQERQGHRPVIRCAPSFVRLCAGQAMPAPLENPANDESTNHGLIVVGSHTSLTNSQLDAARRDHTLRVVELDVAAVLRGDEAYRREIDRCHRDLVSRLEHGDVVVHTSRLAQHDGQQPPLRSSNRVADALVSVVERVTNDRALPFLVAKGGITSSDMAVRALRTTRARVKGQMFAGTVPVWELLDGLTPGLTYVVFPGNVGGPNALSDVLTKLGRHDA